MTRIEPFSLELASPLSTARGEIERRRGFLVGVEAERDGERLRGVGEATPLPGWTEDLETCREALQRGPEGRPSDAGESNDPAMLSAPAASHGTQLARLDLQARARDEPLTATLAQTTGIRADPAESVPVNATVGDDDVEGTVRAARSAVTAGFDTLKLKVGTRSLSADLDRVAAVVDAVDASVRLDANGAWDVPTADRAVTALADRGLDVEYLEQPLDAPDLDGLAALRGRGVAIAVDESLARAGLEEVLRHDAADVAVLKPMALGGPATALAVANRLRSQGIDPVITTTVDGAVARTAAVHAAACLPDVRACGLATGEHLASDLGPDPVPVEHGRIEVPDSPGTVGDQFDHLLWD